MAGAIKVHPGATIVRPVTRWDFGSVLSSAAASISRYRFYAIGREYDKYPIRSTVACFLALVMRGRAPVSATPEYHDSRFIRACLPPSTPPLAFPMERL